MIRALILLFFFFFLIVETLSQMSPISLLLPTSTQPQPSWLFDVLLVLPSFVYRSFPQPHFPCNHKISKAVPDLMNLPSLQKVQKQKWGHLFCCKRVRKLSQKPYSRLSFTSHWPELLFAHLCLKQLLQSDWRRPFGTHSR